MNIELVILGFLWYQVIAIFGLSIGLHRYFSHRQFKVSNTFEVICLFLSMLAGSRSPIGWIGAHRMHHKYSDTWKDPHSPSYVGFWTVAFNQWELKNIPRSCVRDLYDNKIVMFFDKYWLYMHLVTSIVVLLLSIELFIVLIVSPYVLAFVGYGMFNALGHKDNKAVTNMFINILSAGEGWHNVHHNNPTTIKLNKYDLSGLIVQRFFL
jgi:fatty-acid desaturase